MTRVKYYPEEYHVSIEGHAGYAPAGQDIVCAGISALMWTLIAAAQENTFNMHLYINELEAKTDVRCYPDEDSEDKCKYLFDTIVRGFEMIAKQYPQNIKIGGSYGNL